MSYEVNGTSRGSNPLPPTELGVGEWELLQYQTEQNSWQKCGAFNCGLSASQISDDFLSKLKAVAFCK